MSRNRERSIPSQFAPRLIEMLEAPAYRVLSLSARRVIDHVEIELAHHGGNDNGRLPVTYEDFESYGIDRGSIAPAIREAVALGFLEITEKGRAGNAEWRKPNYFRLTLTRRPRGACGANDRRRTVSYRHWRSRECAPTGVQTAAAQSALKKPDCQTKRTTGATRWSQKPAGFCIACDMQLCLVHRER